MASDPKRAVLDALPHRPPFLFVDRIVERTPTAIVTEWHVPHDLECFKGHYPGDPVLPGVIACEFAFQSAAIFLSDPRDARTEHASPAARSALPNDESPGAVPVLARIDDARFKRIVRPGETLRADVELEERLSSACYMRARVTSAGKTVMQLKFVVALSRGGSLASGAAGVAAVAGDASGETGAPES